MTDIVERLRFDSVRCEMQFSKGVAGNIEEAVAEIERLRAENANLRRWKALDKPITAAMEIANSHLGRLRATLRGLVSEVANDPTYGRVIRSRAYAEAQRLCSDNEQSKEG